MKHAISVIAGLTLASGIALAGDDMKDAEFDNLDANGDGVISQAEIAQETGDMAIREHFAKADVDQNGYLDKQEFDGLKDNLEDYAEEAE